MSTDIVAIPFHNQTIQSAEINGEVHVVLRPIVEALGMDYASQSRRLSEHSWATLVKMTMVGADGKNREMTCVPVRTLTMWLATINENKVNEAARPLVIAYQNEVADAIEAYWTKGGAINPRATDEQKERLFRNAKMDLELCQMAQGMMDATHLEAKVNIILARGIGEAPELDAASRLLYVSDFLKEKGVSTKRRKSIAGAFGKRAKAAYTRERGHEPKKYPLEMENGQVRLVYAYTEEHRPMLEEIWTTHYTK